jgi:diaminopimelate decarboxylase
MNIDVVRRSVQLPPLSVGDYLVIAPVGAYNTTQSMQFIEYRPATVLIHGDHEVSIIRQAEDLSVVTGPERLPSHLRSIASEPSGRVLPLRVAGG